MFARMALISTLVFCLNANATEKFGIFSCQNSYQNICGDHLNISDERATRIESIQKSMNEPALMEAYKVIDSENQMPSDFDLDQISTIKKKSVRAKVTKVFLASVRKEMDAYLKRNHFPSNLNEGLIKQSLIETVKESNLDSNSKTMIEGTIKATKFIALTELDADNAPSSFDVMKIYKGCSKEEFVDNAFADENKKGTFVVICPGEIIGAIEFAKAAGLSDDKSYLALVMTIAHELGHHFDFRKNPELYSNLVRTLQPVAEQTKTRKIEDYMSELSADFWGMKSLLKILKSKNISSKDQSKILAGALEDLCGTEDDETHPSGQFRIENIAVPMTCGPNKIDL